MATVSSLKGRKDLLALCPNTKVTVARLTVRLKTTRATTIMARAIMGTDMRTKSTTMTTSKTPIGSKNKLKNQSLLLLNPNPKWSQSNQLGLSLSN